ncbi:MAG: ABC transporter permease subunit [Eggerthellaceae bacterium]|nr:ABC transporter permease subunit [Eggerthellaceae bacterium]
MTVSPAEAILNCTNKCAWWNVRIKDRVFNTIYALYVLSMVVPLQMEMLCYFFIVDRRSYNTRLGLKIIYMGFGAGLTILIFCGFICNISLEIEEVALIYGCSTPRMFLLIVLP